MKQRFSTRTRLVSALLTLAMVFTFLPFSAFAEEELTDNYGIIPLAEYVLPDKAFREYLKEFDTNGDEILAPAERYAVTEIHAGDKNISNLYGIQFFPNLKMLYCYNNQLTKLDVSKNTALVYLDCSQNQLTELDVRQNAALWGLFCEGNQLSSLDVSNNTALDRLDCHLNNLTSLDLRYNTKLTQLGCNSNNLTSLDVSQNPELWLLNCSINQLTELDVSKNTNLKSLYCSDNQLTELDLSRNNKIFELEANNNYLTSLNVNNTSINIDNSSSKFFALGNTYPITVGSDRTFDLSTLPGTFDVTKATRWNGGTVRGNTLTVDAGATKVTYLYNCGKRSSYTFTLNVTVVPEGSIKQVNIRVNTPKKNEMPDETVVILDNGADVCDVKIRWGMGDIGGEPIPGSFRPGKQYTLQVGLYAKPGYKFSKDTVCTVNGREAKFLMTTNNDTEYYAIKSYVVPLTPGGFEHDHKMEMTHDEYSHWMECPICHTVQDTEGHVYDDDKDTTCNVCGYVRSLTPGGSTPGGSTGGDTPGGGSTGGGDGGGAVVIVAAAGAAVAGVVGYGVYNYVSGRKLQALLPEGVAAPENRAQTALLLWNTAGRPEPADAPAFADVADPDTAKAAQWCVEQGLMKRRLNGKFAPGSSIPAYQVLNAYRKLAGG